MDILIVFALSSAEITCVFFHSMWKYTKESFTGKNYFKKLLLASLLLTAKTKLFMGDTGSKFKLDDPDIYGDVTYAIILQLQVLLYL